MSTYGDVASFKATALPVAALAGITDPQILAFITAASGVIDDYLRPQFALPIAAPYPDSLIQRTYRIARYQLLVWRGVSPEDPGMKTIRDDHDAAMSWARDVAKGLADPGLSTIDASPTEQEGAPEVIGEPPRGW